MLPINITPNIEVAAFQIYLKNLIVFWYKQSQVVLSAEERLICITRAETYDSLLEDISGMYSYSLHALGVLYDKPQA